MESGGPGGPGLPAAVKVSRKRIGVICASLGVLGGALAGWAGAWLGTFLWSPVMLAVAALFYYGVSRESKVWVARGLVFVDPKTIGKQTTGLSESICKPEAIKEAGDAVLVISRWSELRIVFHDAALRASFLAEVSGLLKR